MHMGDIILPALLPEVLSYIFELLAVIWPPDLTRDRHRDKLGFVVVTHVNRLWRQSAIGYSKLWTTIDDLYTALWSTFAERARALPLTIIPLR